MSLTVPKAGVTAGRAAQVQTETPQTGNIMAQFGQHMLAAGTRIENDRLSRQMNRLSVDLTKDMNDLRLETQQIGDPDAMGQHWDARVAEIRNSFLSPDPETGQRRVDPKNTERFNLAFDDLANKHGFAIGQQQLASRYSQRAATLLDYEHAATNAAATGDPTINDAAVAEHAKQVDELVASGALSPEAGARKKLDFANALSNTTAITMIENDPQTFLDMAEAGAFSGMDGAVLARNKKQAQSAIEARQTAALRAQEKATDDRNRANTQQLTEYLAAAPSGRLVVDEAWFNSDDVRANPKWPEANAAIMLAREQPQLQQMAPAQIDALIADERKSGINKKWQNDRLSYLEKLRSQVADGYAKDPIGQARKSGLNVPDLPTFNAADPAAFAQALSARRAAGQWLVQNGYAKAPRVLDNDELTTLRALSSPDSDPDTRVALALSMAGGLGDMKQINEISDDPVFGWASGLLEDGAAPSQVREIFRGQQVMAEKNITMPPVADRAGQVFAQTGALFADVAGGEKIQAALTATADAIYAARARRVEPDKELDTELYRQALHEAAGGIGAYDSATATGGIQELRGTLTPLPAGVSSRAAATALARAGAVRTPVSGSGQGKRPGFTASPDLLADQFRAAAHGHAPQINGVPLSPDDMDAMTLRAVGNDAYALIWNGNAGQMVLEDEQGDEFTFSLRQLIREVEK